MKSEPKKLYRSNHDRIIAGVAGGLAEYFDVDSTLVRALFVILVFTGWGAGILLYILLAVIVHPEPSVSSNEKGVHKEESTPERRTHTKNFVAIVLIAIGAIVLLNKFFPMEFFRWDLIWPIALILLGFFVLTKKADHL